jgi:hemoglobin
MEDIKSREDVAFFVESFYSKVLKNDELKGFFSKLDFQAHLPKMIHFWAFVLLDEPNYTTNVTEKHLKMPLKKENFDTWIHLFNQTIDENFSGELAELAKQRAYTIGWTISNKMGLN